jgi:hypothetical protein
MVQPPSKTGVSRAVVLVKAVPQASGSHGETVCVAALDAYGNWHRLYPVNFRDLRADQKFGRWDEIEFSWRLPEVSKDRRAESKRIDQASVHIIGTLKPSERARYSSSAETDSTNLQYKQGKSLALIRPRDPKFYVKRRSDAEIERVRKGYEEILRSPDFFGTTDIVPREAAPFEFYYKYSDSDGQHDQRCHDWETEQTFLNWRAKYGEEQALKEMQRVFGEEYPAKGMALATQLAVDDHRRNSLGRTQAEQLSIEMIAALRQFCVLRGWLRR